MLGFEIARVVEAYESELQDRAEVIETAGGLVVVVADGAGGRAGGAEAAERAVEMIRAAAAVTPPRQLGEPRTWAHLLT